MPGSQNGIRGHARPTRSQESRCQADSIEVMPDAPVALALSCADCGGSVIVHMTAWSTDSTKTGRFALDSPKQPQPTWECPHCLRPQPGGFLGRLASVTKRETPTVHPDVAAPIRTVPTIT